MYRRQPPRRHACGRCVQLKVKCVPRGGTAACERCTRLGHSTCVFPRNVRGNNTTRHAPQGLQLDLDTTRPLWSSQPDNPASLDVSPSSRRESTPQSITGQDSGDDLLLYRLVGPKQLDDLVAKYRTHKMPQYPFVVIPSEIDAAALRQQSPFLLLCIVLASVEHDMELQHTLESVVRTEIATRLIVKIERSLELLQGLLVHIAWYHYHWKSYHTQMYMLLQMAITVASDLRLDCEDSFRMQVIPPEGKEHPDTRGPISQTAAGQRALLGCYYLCSNSSIFRRQLMMRHTKWMDHCAVLLARNGEYPTDIDLKTYIHVQSLAQRSRLLFDEELNPNLENSPVTSWGDLLKVAAEQQTRAGDFSYGSDSDSYCALRLELSAAPTLVLGQALQRRRDVFKLQEMNHLDLLTSSAHRILTVFLSCPCAVAVHLPASAYGTVWYALLVLSKLSVLFHDEPTRPTGVDSRTIHDRGLAIMQKLGELSKGDDVWKNSQTVIGSMFIWLEKSNAEACSRRTFPITLESRTTGTECGYSLSHTESLRPPSATRAQDALGPIGGNLDTQATWVGAFPETNHTVTSGVHTQDPYEYEPGIWEQMLESFTWFGPTGQG